MTMCVVCKHSGGLWDDITQKRSVRHCQLMTSRHSFSNPMTSPSGQFMTSLGGHSSDVIQAWVVSPMTSPTVSVMMPLIGQCLMTSHPVVIPPWSVSVGRGFLYDARQGWTDRRTEWNA